MAFDFDIELALKKARAFKDPFLFCHAVWDSVIVDADTISRIVDWWSMFTAGLRTKNSVGTVSPLYHSSGSHIVSGVMVER